MKQFSLSVLVAILFSTITVSSQTIFYTDFGLRMPDSVHVCDLDENTPSQEMQDAGFSPSSGWIWKCSDEDLNGYACSTSWYESAGKADDWLLLPAVTLDCEKPVLQWRAHATDRDLRDGYAVYLAEGRVTDPKSMKEAILLCRVEAENSDWTWREISLEAYKNREVTIAFVNDSRDCCALCLDDVYAGNASSLRLSLSSSPIVRYESGMPLSGIVCNTGTSTLSGFTISYKGPDGMLSRRFDTVLAAGEEADFSLEAVAPFDNNDYCLFTLTVTDGTDTRSYPLEARRYNTSVYVEEGTGIWCGFCVRGIVYMDRMETKYPDNFIGVVVHKEDKMECTELVDQISSNFDFYSFPCCVINRSKTIDPTDLPRELEKVRHRVCEPTSMSLSAKMEGDNINITTGIRFARPVRNCGRYSVALVLMEDSVHNPTYCQNNEYAGSGQDMDGWENKNTLIPGNEMWYRNVSRALITDFEGDASLLPDEVEQEVIYEKTYTFAIPEELDSKKVVRQNLYVAAVLLDSQQGIAINAAKARVTPSSGTGYIILSPLTDEVSYYDLTGRRLSGPGRGISICITPEGKAIKTIR